MKEAFLDWLTARATACETNRAALSAEGREDEARFERIRYNVYDLLRTTVNAIHRAEAEENAAWRRFEQRLGEIVSSWQKGRELARQHGDAEKAHIERIKLEAAEDVRRRYEGLRGAGA